MHDFSICKVKTGLTGRFLSEKCCSSNAIRWGGKFSIAYAKSFSGDVGRFPIASVSNKNLC